jgi:hypothetical protein
MSRRLILFLWSFAAMTVVLLFLVHWQYSQTGAAVATAVWFIAVVTALSEADDFGISASYFVSKSGGIEYWTDEGSNLGAICSGVIVPPILLSVGRIVVMMVFHK